MLPYRQVACFGCCTFAIHGTCEHVHAAWLHSGDTVFCRKKPVAALPCQQSSSLHASVSVASPPSPFPDRPLQMDLRLSCRIWASKSFGLCLPKSRSISFSLLLGTSLQWKHTFLLWLAAPHNKSCWHASSGSRSESLATLMFASTWIAKIDLVSKAQALAEGALEALLNAKLNAHESLADAASRLLLRWSPKLRGRTVQGLVTSLQPLKLDIRSRRQGRTGWMTRTGFAGV